MRKTFITILAVLTFVSCGSSDKSNNGPVKELDYKTFVNEIWDIDAHPNAYVYQNELPCIIDFYADWCGPCRQVAPIMEELAKEYEGKLIVYKVNVDEEKKLPTIFEVENIPTVYFMPKEGQPLCHIGALSKEEYISIINEYLIN